MEGRVRPGGLGRLEGSWVAFWGREQSRRGIRGAKAEIGGGWAGSGKCGRRSGRGGGEEENSCGRGLEMVRAWEGLCRKDLNNRKAQSSAFELASIRL